MRQVENRSAEILLPIIREVVRPGSIIWIDKWSAYINLQKMFIHQTVNNNYNFICLETGAHTQKIESYWNKVKLKLKARRDL